MCLIVDVDALVKALMTTEKDCIVATYDYGGNVRDTISFGYHPDISENERVLHYFGLSVWYDDFVLDGRMLKLMNGNADIVRLIVLDVKECM